MLVICYFRFIRVRLLTVDLFCFRVYPRSLITATSGLIQAVCPIRIHKKRDTGFTGVSIYKIAPLKVLTVYPTFSLLLAWYNNSTCHFAFFYIPLLQNKAGCDAILMTMARFPPALPQPILHTINHCAVWPTERSPCRSTCFQKCPGHRCYQCRYGPKTL